MRRQKIKTNKVKIILTAILGITALCIAVAIYMSTLYSGRITSGVVIDGVDISNMPYEKAYTVLNSNAEEIIEKIVITFTHKDKAWSYNAKDIGARLKVKEALKEASTLARTGSLSERIKEKQSIKKSGYIKSSTLLIEPNLVENILENIAEDANIPMVESTIEFDPTDYDYFQDIKNSDVDMSRDMFEICDGKSGYIVNVEATINDMLSALKSDNVVSVELAIKEILPRYTKHTLESCTTLVCHSSSKVKSYQRMDSYRNRNIEKALSYIKGLVVKPGEIISLNKLLGERTQKNGWLSPPCISRDPRFRSFYGYGINQVATTLHNAVFTADLKVLDHGFHQYPAYYNDFGMGMDAMINWGTSDFVFKNTTEYPVFFDAYLLYHSDSRPLCVDIDVYTMPKEDGAHIRAEYVIDETIPSDVIYIEDTKNRFAYENWKLDETLNKMIYIYNKPRNTQKVSVYKVWYKDCTEDKPGVFTGGVEVKRELSHTVTYPGVDGLVYTKPIEKEDG